MKRLFPVVALSLLWACQDSTPVGPEPVASPALTVVEAHRAADADVMVVPFKMKGTWWPTADGDAGPCDQFPEGSPMFLEWEGNATHMGIVTGSVTNCFGAGPIGGRPLLSQTTTMVAANGDVLLAHGSASQDGIGLIIYPDLSFEIGPVPFVGGTGRFDGASGWFWTFADNIMGGSFTMEGQVSTVGSNK